MVATKVSVAMIIRNEAKGLPAAIASVRHLSCVDEIMVLDTGSDDGSQEIARELGARVVEEPWESDFSLHRNRAAELCRNDWIFCLDGDEELSDPGGLDAFFLDVAGDGVVISVQAIGVTGPAEMLNSIRAYDRRKCHWRYPVHNVLVGWSDLRAVDAKLTAYYDADIFDTTRRRSEVLRQRASDEPDEPHYPFYLAKAARVLREWPRVLFWVERYLDLEPASPAGAQAWLWRVEAHLALGDQESAERHLRAAVELHRGYADLHHMELTLAMQRWQQACAVRNSLYLGVPVRSVSYSAHAVDAARTLGLPLAVVEVG